MELNPQRCETCENFSCVFCPKRLRPEGEIIIYHSKPALFTAEYGCASHSSAPVPEDADVEPSCGSLEGLQEFPFSQNRKIHDLTRCVLCGEHFKSSELGLRVAAGWIHHNQDKCKERNL